jgi:hypothetical protein
MNVRLVLQTDAALARPSPARWRAMPAATGQARHGAAGEGRLQQRERAGPITPVYQAPGACLGPRRTWRHAGDRHRERPGRGRHRGDGLCSLDENVESCVEDCTDNPGCGGAENYVHFDPATLTLTTRREAIGVAWYTTGGSFAQARTGRAPEEPEASSDNVWTAPDEAGDDTLWVVLRDDRGATGSSGEFIAVGP